MTSRHLKAVSSATAQPRAVLYLRQSTHREESISLEVQESAARAYCSKHGYDVVAVEADPGISGRTWKRPAVQRVMSLIETREADVIVLWRWSRLSRSRLDWAVAADRCDMAGGRIESATEPNDPSAAGRFARGVMTELAAFESERIGEGWKEAHARRVAMGVPANGKRRFGYESSRETGFTPHPIEGPILAETYRRYNSGESLYSLIEWLQAGPTRTLRGNAWSQTTLRRVLDSGFAAGYFTRHEELLKGAHEALITEEQWQQYLEARERRRGHGGGERSTYALSGLVRCVCGSRMHGSRETNNRPRYRCAAAKERRTHEGGYVSGPLVEAEVHAWLIEQNDQWVRQATAASLSQGPAVRPVADPTSRIRADLARLDIRMDTLVDRLLDGIPQDAFERARDRIESERAGLERELRTVGVRARKAPVTILPALLERWDDLGPREKRELLASVIDHVLIGPGRPQASITIIPRTDS
ncbi:recombinase family protein [Pseudoclavibacter sp. VKM Ac-2888]|uniref:recombinase family protein n=1 Tax=Pseudoclavibacter sp. VKM Ac-2888 TaxID=2783830 RepID=UPI00188D3A57|nr:recombinase family protein [Pseudoclavibacter sp. VKM Ac-2888]MBF4549707.1 recombinase family protein [Pseudoclavibacter sp. VKM Ac-2888]